MVDGISRNCASLIILFQSSEPVHETLCSGFRPITYGFFVTVVWFPRTLLFRHNIIGLYLGIFIDFRNTPCRRAISNKSVGQQDNGSHVLQSDFSRLKCHIETIGRCRGCQHYHRTLPIATVESLQQVGLFGFRRQSRGRSTSLNIDNDQRQFRHNG